MDTSRRITRKIVDTFNSVVKNEVNQPIPLLKKVIAETANTNIAERSLLYSLLSDLYYEECKYHDAYTAAYQAYNIDPKRKEVLHSLMNVHLPRPKLHNNNNNNNVRECKVNSYENGETAEKYAHKLETLYPTDIQALNMAAVAYGELKRYDTALRCLITAHEQLLETERQFRRKSFESNCSSSGGSSSSIDYNMDSNNNSNNHNSDLEDENYKSDYRRTIESTITNLFLSRYRECPDDENFKIMTYLMELLNFKYHSLTNEQITMAKDEICERAEYVLNIQLKRENFILCQRVVQMVGKLDLITQNLIGKIGQFYQTSNQCDLGVKYFTRLLEGNPKDPKIRFSLHYFRGNLYKALGMPKEAKKDLDTSVQLGKLRSTPQNMSRINTNVKKNFNHNNNNNNRNNNINSFGQDSKDVECDENANPNISNNNINNNNYNSNLNNGSVSRQDQKRGSRISDTMIENNGNIFISPRCATPIGLPGVVNGPSLSQAIDDETEDEEEEDDTDDNNINNNNNNNNINNNSNNKLNSIAQTGRRMPRPGFLQNLEQKESEMNNYNYMNMNVNSSNSFRNNNNSSINIGNNIQHQQEFLLLKQQFTKSKNENLRLNSQIVDLKNEIHREQQKLNKLTNELNNARCQISKLENERNDNDMGCLNSSSSSSTDGNINNGEIAEYDPSDIKALKDELKATQEELQYFRTQWADSKTRCENLLNKIKERDEAMSDLRIEYDNECEQRKSLEKELNIMKDANSKTKMRRRSQQFAASSMNDNEHGNGNGNNTPMLKRHSDTALIASFMNDNNGVISDVRKQLIPSNSPWIDRARAIFQRKNLVPNASPWGKNRMNNNNDGRKSKVVQLPPIRGASKHPSQRLINQSFSLNNCEKDKMNRGTIAIVNNNGSSLQAAGRVAAEAVRNSIASEQELNEKMKKITDECHEMQVNSLYYNRERDNDGRNGNNGRALGFNVGKVNNSDNDDEDEYSGCNGCIKSLFSYISSIIAIIGVLYCIIVSYNCYQCISCEYNDDEMMNHNIPVCDENKQENCNSETNTVITQFDAEFDEYAYDIYNNRYSMSYEEMFLRLKNEVSKSLEIEYWTQYMEIMVNKLISGVIEINIDYTFSWTDDNSSINTNTITMGDEEGKDINLESSVSESYDNNDDTTVNDKANADEFEQIRTNSNNEQN